jgi:hypothetical protein
MAITTDGLSPSAFSKRTHGAMHGVVWAENNTNYFSWTPTGGQEIQFISTGISVDTAGTYELRMASGQDVITHLSADVIHPIHAKMHRDGGATLAGNMTVWI